MQHYVKTRSRATMKGEWYEVKVAALLYLRSKNSARVTHYQLVTNLDGAAALDDIAHRVKNKDDPDTWHTSFIQLKHKERATLGVNSFTGLKGDFSLRKYKDSFIEIRKSKQDNDCNNRLFFDGSFDNFQFVIYTNSKVKPHSYKSSLIEPGSLEELLKSDCENELIFRFDRERNKEVFAFLEDAEDTRADAAEFLEKLTVFSGQPNESELDDMIKKELLIACGGQVSDAGPVYRIFEGLFKEWWRDSNVVLDETSDILQRAIDQLSSEAELTKQTEKCTLDLNFDEKLWTSFNTGFSEGVSLLHVVTTGGSLRLSATKVLRLLHAERLSFTFISLEYLLQHQQVLIPDWRDGYKDCLVVVVSDYEESQQKEQLSFLSNCLNEVLKHKPNKKAVVVSCHGCQLASNVKERDIVSNKSINDTFDLTHLDEACRTKIFSAKVSFQNHELAFKTLYDEDSKFWDSLLCDDLMARIISQYGIPIGEKLPDVIQHFIPRQMKRENVIRSDIFKPGYCYDTIAVTGVTLQDLKGLLGRKENILLASVWLHSPGLRHDLMLSGVDSTILVLNSFKTVEEFNEICAVKLVHWLHMEDGVWSWIKSNRDISNVKKFTDKPNHSKVQSDSVMNSENRELLVIAEPGMGKTSLMPFLAQASKNANPTDWVILINLRDHSELFNQSQQLSALDFLTSALHLGSPLEKAFLRVSLEETGNVIVLLDSFDEISPRYEQEGCDLLTSILKSRVKKVVVTSRHCMQEKLENHMFTIAYTIIEFSIEDQKMFFRKFWPPSSTPMTPNQLEDFIVLLLDSIHAIDIGKRLLGIPLQTMMTAEVFNGHVIDPEHNTFPQKIDILELFKLFVERKFMIYFSKGNNNLNKEDSRKKFILDHMHAALKLLVHEKDIKKLNFEEDIVVKAEIFLKNIEEAKDNSGLVIGVINKRPIFLHQMFAEYLAALWFAEYFNSNINFLKQHLFMPNYNVILIMFDRILSKDHQLHEAVLDMDMVRVETLLAVGGVDVNSRDLGGRTALHLAAALGFEFEFDSILAYTIGREGYEKCRTTASRPKHMVELLIEYGADVNLADTVLKWNPLEYALTTKTWDAMEYLLANQALCSKLKVSLNIWTYNRLLEDILIYGFVNILALLFQDGLSANYYIFGTPLLYYASRYGYVECVELLLSKGADKRATGPFKDFSLHAAARLGHISVVRVLVEYKNNVSISTFLKSKYKSNFLHKYVRLKNGRGQSALHLATTSELCLFLISRGADLWSLDKKRKTCLHTICMNGRLPVVETLIKCLGPNGDEIHKFINAVDDNQNSAIMLASKQGYADIVRHLICHGADVWSRDKWGRSCLHSSGSDEVARVIIESLGEDIGKVIKLINSLDNKGVSALAEASGEGFKEVVEILVSNGANVWVQDMRGRTSLHAAAMECHCSVAQVLINSLGNVKTPIVEYVNIRDNKGVSALALASRYYGKKSFVDLLISHGADVWSRDLKGKTSLHRVAEKWHLSAALSLIGSLGDDKAAIVKYINVRDDKGLTALQVEPELFTSPEMRLEFLDWLETTLTFNSEDFGV